MSLDDFQTLIDTDSYQVFILTSPASVPVHFASHPWFVLNNRGKLARWEVLFRKNTTIPTGGHLSLNFLEPFQGLEVFSFTGGVFWKPRLLGIIENDVDNLAERMIAFIEHSPQTYPYCTRYHLLGPNSNSYVKWVLDHFPECTIKLPWNAFGKNFKIIRSEASNV